MAARKRSVTQTRTLKRGPNKGDTVRVRASSSSQLKKGNWYPVAVTSDRKGRNTSRVARQQRKKKGSSKKRHG